MRYRVIASITGVLSVVFGLLLLIVPGTLTSIYGIAATDREAMILRLLGASYAGYGALAWAALGLRDRAGRRAVVIAQVVAWLLGLPVSVAVVSSGLTNGLGWSVVALQILVPIAWIWAFLETS